MNENESAPTIEITDASEPAAPPAAPPPPLPTAPAPYVPTPAKLTPAATWKFLALAERRAKLEREMRDVLLLSGVDAKALDTALVALVENESSPDFGTLVDARSNQPILLPAK